MQVTCTDFYGKAHVVDSKDLVDRLSVYGIYIVDDKVLLIQDPRSGRWELPGGGVEKGETVRQGLIREYTEETGVTPTGRFSLVTEWVEYYFDVPTKKAWRSKRRFYFIKSIWHADRLLTDGNGDDSATAQLVPLAKLKMLHTTNHIQEVVGLVSDRLARLQ